MDSFIRNILQTLQGKWLQVRTFYQRRLYSAFSLIYALAGILSLLVLILEFGFTIPDFIQSYFPAVVRVLIAVLLGYEVISILMTSEGAFLKHLRSHLFQLLVIGFVLMQLLFYREILFLFRLEGYSYDRMSLALLFFSQFLLLIGSFNHLLRRPRFFKTGSIHPSQAFMGSFALAILVGFALLMLPRTQTGNLPAIDLFFNAVSAVCVTGLVTFDVSEQLTRSGQVVTLILIQMGGLGVMTLTSFFAYFLTGRASVSTRLFLKDVLSEKGINRIKNLIRSIAIVTFSIEILGAGFLYLTMPEHLYANTTERIFIAVFESISAFCNAGFSLHTGSLMGLMDSTRGGLYVGGHMILIMLGGLGFPVVIQLAARAARPHNPYDRLSVSTRMVLVMNVILWVGGMMIYLVLEQGHTLHNVGWSDQLLHSLFFAVTTRTAGFNTLPVDSLGMATAFIACFFMWVGASPQSTGGGIKTTTFAISILHIYNQLTGRAHVEVFRRTVAPRSVSVAFAAIVLSLLVIFAGVFALVLIEPFGFMDLAFEVVSAFGTVGLSRGITAELSSAGKLIICLLMFCGRVGLLTVLTAITPKPRPVEYRYPEAEILVG